MGAKGLKRLVRQTYLPIVLASCRGNSQHAVEAVVVDATGRYQVYHIERKGRVVQRWFRVEDTP